MDLSVWIRRVPGMFWMPAKHWNDTPLFTVEPDLLVVHSGSIAEDVAEFERDIGQVEYTDKTTGELHIVLTCYHVAWSTEQRAFVQQVELCCEAWHAGGSLWRGQSHTNAHSLSMAFPGPAAVSRPTTVLDAAVNAVVRMQIARPSVKYWCRHSDVDLNKRDPGAGVPNSIFDGILEYVPERHLHIPSSSS